jgi:toxin HigB-1
MRDFTVVTRRVTLDRVIRSFRHAGLRELFETGKSSKVRHDLQARTLRRLDALDRATTLRDIDVPGFNFHRLAGKPTRYSVHVNGPWCVTFEWDQEDACRVDLEQYH